MTTGPNSANARSLPKADALPLSGNSEAEFVLSDLRLLSHAAYLAASGIQHIAEESEIDDRDTEALIEINRVVMGKAKELERLLFGEDTP